MKFSLKGKRVIITGGGSGIGEAISKTFAESGALVHILELRLDNAQETVTNILKNGGTAEAHECDVSNQKQVNTVVASILEKGPIAILVNNAGIAHVGNIENTTVSDMDRIYNVNIKGVYNCAAVVIPSMKEKGGVILNMASIASSVGISDRFAYSMSKGAALTMTYSIAKDYLNDGIRCNSCLLYTSDAADE